MRMHEPWVNGAPSLSLLTLDTWSWWLSVTRSVSSGSDTSEQPEIDDETIVKKPSGYLALYKIMCLKLKMSSQLFENLHFL